MGFLKYHFQPVVIETQKEMFYTYTKCHIYLAYFIKNDSHVI